MLRSRSRSTRPAALGPTMVCTSAATSLDVLSLKMESACPEGAVAGCGVLRDDGTELPSRLAGVEVAPGELLRALVTPRRGRVLGVGGAGLET